MGNDRSTPTGLFIVYDGMSLEEVSRQIQYANTKLKAQGYRTKILRFPTGRNPSNYLIQQYTQTAGSELPVGPYTSALFYALDHFEMSQEIRNTLADDVIILCQGYVATNMVNHGSLFVNTEERRGFYIWLDNLEFEMLKTPRPNMTFILQSSLNGGNSSGKTSDARLDLCKLFPQDFTSVDMFRNKQALTDSEIGDIIWQKIAAHLPERPQSSEIYSENVPLQDQTDESLSTAKPDSTSVESSHRENIKVKLRENHYRVTYYADDKLKANKLSATKISVNEESVSVLIEAGSSLLLLFLFLNKHLLSNLSYQQNNADTFREVDIPAFSEALKVYRQDFSSLLMLGKNIKQKYFRWATESKRLTDEDYANINDLLRPLAASSRIVFDINLQNLYILVKLAKKSASREVRIFGEQTWQNTLVSGPKGIDDLLQKSLQDDYREYHNDKIDQLFKNGKNYGAGDIPTIKLLAYSPHAETNVLLGCAYENVSGSFSFNKNNLDAIGYDTKARLLHSAIKTRIKYDTPNTFFEFVRYDIEVKTSLSNIFWILSVLKTPKVIMKLLTPSLGFDIPIEIEKAKLIDPYEKYFGQSLKLTSKMQQDKQTDFSQYAFLMGHLQCCMISFSVNDIVDLIAAQHDNGTNETKFLINLIIDEIETVHPIIGDSLAASIV